MLSRRRGFSTAEILVAIAVIAILASVLVPAVVTAVGRARVRSAQQSLEAISDAIATFEDNVGTGGNRIGYPSTLDQLVVPITTASANICGDTYLGGQVNGWDGPYLHRPIPASGLPISVGTVAATFGVLIDASAIDFLTVDVSDVTDEDAAALDRRIDGGDGATAGTLRWTAAGNGLVTLRWLFPYPDC